ncbi:PaaI family thioesterase [Hwanghaeella grinnelliae]|uniref:PaaI family thioesterase n=2 Tax=Hwanghaeella grinnelliae TaxID=2500179 RepID=A0A3S2WW09_9PROT|nr:PaaI family thioesterase [Hwanghaeella grinnelliae]
MEADKEPLDGSLYPYQELLGYEIAEWEQGRCRVTMPIRDCHTNRHGIPHGGVYASLLDTAMGFAGSYSPPGEEKRFAMTLSLTTNFLSRPKGLVLQAEANVNGGGRNTFFCEGSIVDETGEVIATGIGTFRLRRSKSA